MGAVYTKEMRALFASPLGWVFLASFCAVENLFFYLLNIRQGLADLNGLFSNTLIILVFLLPILTMRTFSEEYRQRTDQLLFTSRLRVSDIVMGKFFAVFTVFIISLASTAVWPLIVSRYGTLELASLVGNYVALVLAASAFIAIGMYISARTESQLIAALISFSIFFAIYILDYASGKQSDTLLFFLVRRFSLFYRYGYFAKGIFRLDDAVFYLSVSVLALTLTRQTILHRLVRSSRTRSLLSAGTNVALLVSVLMLNLIATEITNRFFMQADMTSNRLYTLSAQTEAYIASLDEPVTIYALDTEKAFLETPGLFEVGEVLRQYAALSGGLVRIEYVDTYKNPGFFAKYNFTATPSSRSLLVTSAEKHRLIDIGEEIFLVDYDQQEARYKTTGFDAEKRITSAILYTQQETSSTVAMLVGHNERMPDGLREMLTSANYAVVDVNLSQQPLPADCTFALLVAPLADYLPQEVDALDAYLAGEGQLMVFIGPESPHLPNLMLYFEEWGARYTTAFVLDESRSIGSPAFLAPLLAEHEMVGDIVKSNMALIAPFSRGIDILWTEKGTRHVSPLMVSGDTSYQKAYGNDLQTLVDFAPDADSVMGQTPIALLVEDHRFESRTLMSRILFSGSAMMLADEMLQTSSFLNRDYVQSAMAYFSPQQDALAFPTTNVVDNRLTILAGEAQWVFWIFSVALPGVLLLSGIGVWRHRRNL